MEKDCSNESQDRTWHTSVAGPEDGHIVLLVHGFPLSKRLWDQIIGPLGDAGYRVIAPDLRGFGDSEPASAFSLGDLAGDLQCVLRDVGQWDGRRRVTYIGLSMGGYIAFEFYRRFGHQLHSLVLMDTRAEADTPEAAEGRRAAAQKVLDTGHAGLVADDMLDKLFGPSASPALKQEWYDIMSGTSPITVAAALCAMADRPDSYSMLPSISCPTLVMVGRDDAITPPEGAGHMQQAIGSNANLCVIETSGHMTPVEQPEACANALISWLESL
ncbi:MAG: alpha/beta hydrolase [Planctomycetes bacterium]|nr:alpha/beta hydrolase [Planctomycetota bacterium]